MTRSKNVAAAVLSIGAWSLLGTVVGLAGAYFLYVKQAPVFASSAVVQVARANAEANPAAEVTDDRLVLLGDPVISRAIELGNLDRAAELAGTNPTVDTATLMLKIRGGLEVQRVAAANTGQLYQITFQSGSAGTAQQVVTAVVAAAKAALGPSDDAPDWQESMRLLSQWQTEIAPRLQTLESQLQELQLPAEAATRQDAVVSPAAESWRRLRYEADQLQQELASLDQKLRRAEALVAEGATAESVLTSLGQSGPVRPAAAGTSEIEQQLAQQAKQRQTQIEARANLTREVQRELAPLQQELDRLLEKFGSEHPTVRGVRTKIEQTTAKLDALPPLDVSPGVAADSGVNDREPSNPSPAGRGPSVSEQITPLMRALRAQRQQVRDQLAAVDERLTTAAGAVAADERVLMEEHRLRREIEQQQAIGRQISDRLGQLSTVAPFPAAELTVIKAATPAVQVAPDMQRYFTTGALAGCLGGLVLASLLLLTAVASGDDGRDAESAK